MGYTNYPKSEFIRRTIVNLDFVEKNQNRANGPYEFTQLMNSFLMAFIHPKAHWINEFPEQPYPAVGWPVVTSIPVPSHELRVPTNARELVIRIRDSLAHGNFEILTAGQGATADIDAVKLWNTPREGSATVIWRTDEIAVKDLRKILDAFVPEMLKIAAKNAE